MTAVSNRNPGAAHRGEPDVDPAPQARRRALTMFGRF
jgi:hypothetical protein